LHLISEREEWEATAEILGNAEMAQQIKHSRKAWAKGSKEEFVSLDDLRAKLNV
jgi:hypothetical protein